MSAQETVAEILKTVEALTTNAKREVDEMLIKKLKRTCKLSDDFVNYTYYALMTQLRKDHAEIRYSTLLVMNELFSRSSAFRKLLESDLEEFLELVVETNLENPLPLPKNVAKELKLKGLQFVQEWSSKFGDKYKRLNLAFTYLKSCKSVDFNDLEARNAVQQERHRQELDSRERAISEKVVKTRMEMQDTSEDILSLLTQIENCFRILVPHPVDFLSGNAVENEIILPESSKSSHSISKGDFSDRSELLPQYLSGKHDDVELRESEEMHIGNVVKEAGEFLRYHGIYDRKSNIVVEIERTSEITIDTNEDTLPVLETLNDLHRQINSKYLPLISKWLKILSKGSNCTDLLRKAIDMKRLVETALEKYKELKIKPMLPTGIAEGINVEEEDDEDEFIEVQEKEGYEPDVPKCSKNINENFLKPCSSISPAFAEKIAKSSKINEALDPTSSAQTVNMLIQKYGFTESITKKKVNENSSIKSQKEDLLSKAPILPYDIDLYHWEEEKPIVPEVIKFDSLHSFWQSKNEDENNEQLQQEKIACLRRRKIDFSGKFEPVKWACRAPLPSGRLCPRQDRYKCPFHGKIVKRDNEGKIADVVSATVSSSQNSDQVPSEDIPDWQDPELLKEIEAATGIDLKMPQKKKSAKTKSLKSKKRSSELTNIKVKSDVRDRLSKKILKRYKHYASKLDDMEKKKFNDKFGDQWNYY